MQYLLLLTTFTLIWVSVRVSKNFEIAPETETTTISIVGIEKVRHADSSLQRLHAMYKTGALIVSSSKLLLPALAAAARLVTGVLYVPLDCVVERMAALAGSEGAQERLGSSSRARESEGPGKEEEQALHYEEKYLHETSQQVNEIDK